MPKMQNIRTCSIRPLPRRNILHTMRTSHKRQPPTQNNSYSTKRKTKGEMDKKPTQKIIMFNGPTIPKIIAIEHSFQSYNHLFLYLNS